MPRKKSIILTAGEQRTRLADLKRDSREQTRNFKRATREAAVAQGLVDVLQERVGEIEGHVDALIDEIKAVKNAKIVEASAPKITKRKGGRPKGSKNKTREVEPEQVRATSDQINDLLSHGTPVVLMPSTMPDASAPVN